MKMIQDHDLQGYDRLYICYILLSMAKYFKEL